jgi:hypothetical protein
MPFQSYPQETGLQPLNHMNNLTPKEKEDLYKYIDKTIWSIHQRDTKILSNTCRQLALAEGGMCWVIISSSYLNFKPYQMNLILLYLLLFFIFDALQYLTTSVLYKRFAKSYNKKVEENKIKDIQNIKLPNWVNSPANVFFILKIMILLSSSLLLISLIMYWCSY